MNGNHFIGNFSPAIRYSPDRKIGGCRCCRVYKTKVCIKASSLRGRKPAYRRHNVIKLRKKAVSLSLSKTFFNTRKQK